MKEYDIKLEFKKDVLALGAESSGNFSIYKKGKVIFNEDFGDLLEDIRFQKYEQALKKVIRKENLNPSVIMCDLHPLFKTTDLAQKLSKKYKAELIQIQHHTAHIYSAIGDKIINNPKFKIPKSLIGIACDGTGLGLDGKIWGGEMFKIQKTENRKHNNNAKLKIDRIGKLEEQILIGGEKAIQEPARMLISILGKFLSKNDVFFYTKKHYSKNEFELLWNQNQQKFNCLETSSTARILDAVSVLLGFSENTRKEKHGPIKLLEENSTTPYKIKPTVSYDEKENMHILETTPLFKFLIKNIKKDKKKLAATAQFYIAEGLYSLITSYELPVTDYSMFFAGGIANNKIISSVLEKNGFYISKQIPRGDAGISFGQLFSYLLSKNNL